MQVFKTALFVGYQLMFGKKYDGDRLGFLAGIPRRCILYEIAGVNHRLKSSDEKQYKTGFEEQFKELKYFCGGEDKITYPHFKRIHSIKLDLERRKGGGTPVIFNRPANLFAFQEVLEKVPDIDASSFKWSGQLWENLLKYYLCVNDVISEYKGQEEDEKHTPFEKLTAASFFLNELIVVNDPILTINRFVHLYKFLEIDNGLAHPLEDYFNKIGISPKDFINNIFSTCFLSKEEKEFLRFHYYMDPDKAELRIPLLLFKYLCRRGLVAKLHELDVSELRKSPVFYDTDNHYIIVDNLFVLEKLYESFINDLWFEAVKPAGIDVRDYKSKIGYFFEQYAS